MYLLAGPLRSPRRVQACRQAGAAALRRHLLDEGANHGMGRVRLVFQDKHELQAPGCGIWGQWVQAVNEARSRLQAADHAGAAAVRSGCTVGVSWRRFGAATAAPVQGPGCRARRRGRQRAVGPCMIWRQGMLPVRRLSAAHPNATPTNHTRG